MKALSASTQGILLMLLAVASFTAMDAATKGLVDRYAPFQIVWTRYAFQSAAITLICLRGLNRMLRTRHPWLQALRCLCGVATTFLFFTSLRWIGLAAATAIADLAPVMITLAAALFLKERIGPRRATGVGVALIGALIIIRPGSDAFTPAALLPLACAATFAGNAILTRRIGSADPVWTSMFYSAALGTLLCTLPLPAVWRTPPVGDLPIFVLVGLLGIAGQLLMILALMRAEASLIAPFGQTDLLCAAFWGYTLYGEVPDLWTWIGALVIAGAGLYVWHRETRATRAAPLIRD